MKNTLVLDIGATKTEVAVLNPQGKFINQARFPTYADKNKIKILDNLWGIIKLHKNHYQIKNIGIAFAGHVDADKGEIIQTTNFHSSFKHIPIKKLIKNKFNLPAALDNDVNCFALGEAVYGIGKKFKVIFGVTLGTGIGGALIYDKKVYHGKNNLAGEVGHTFIKDEKTFEQLAAGPAYHRHHRTALEVKYLARGFSNIINSFDPEIIIVGGGLSNLPKLITRAEKATCKLLHYKATQCTPIKKSRLGHRANLLGAFYLANNL